MRKLFAFVVCVCMMLCVLPIVAFAEAETVEAVVEETPIVEDVPTETMTDRLLGYVKENFEEIVVIIVLSLVEHFNKRKRKELNKSIGTLNNNAVTVAEDSTKAIEYAAAVVTGYKDEIEALLSLFKVNAEEKQKLEQTLAEVHACLKSAKLANVELANEVAELLVLANIPNSKKEELYSRHLAAVGAIADAEKTEVTSNDNGQEAE